MKTQRWNWLDEGLLPALLVLMRTAWLWPWLALLRDWFSPTQPAPVWPLWVIIGLPLLSYLLTDRLLPPRRDIMEAQRVNAVQIALAVTGVLLLLVLTWLHFYQGRFPLWSPSWVLSLTYDVTEMEFELPVQILALCSGFYLWLRGVLDGRDAIHHEKVWGTFLAGVVMFALYLWLSRFGAANLRVDAAPWLIVFFAAGMSALAAANLNIAGGWSTWRRQDNRLQANRYWLLSIAVTIAGLLGLGILLGWLVAPDEVAWLLNGVGMVLGWIWQIFSWLLLGVSFVLFWLIYPIYLFLQSLINNQASEEPPREAQEGLPTPTPEAIQQLTDPTQTPEAFRWLGLVVVLLIVFAIFVLVLRRLRAASEEEPEEIHESIYSNDLLQDQLAAFWQGLRNRFGQGAIGPAFADLTGENDTRRTIRAVYQQVLARAQQSGHPRRSAQTPLEYAPELAETWPQPADAVRVITAGYVEARYGADPPDAATAQAVTAAWTEIEASAREAEEDHRS
ncbi:MAG: DUF4129 domain-containing protein [Caldilineaceae bacterium]|nr:DUF4129 domain-containing protein [Caldilineaceae bacterium]